MLKLVAYDNFRELLRECKKIGLSLVGIDDIINIDYECNECKVILNDNYDNTKVVILMTVHEVDELGLPSCIQVLNISIEPII